MAPSHDEAADAELTGAEVEPAAAPEVEDVEAADASAAAEEAAGAPASDAAEAAEVAAEQADAVADPAATEPADAVTEPEVEPAPAEPAVTAADPIAAAAAAARAEAERVRAAERERAASGPADDVMPVPTPRRAAPGGVRPVAYGAVEPARAQQPSGRRRGIVVAIVVVLLFAAAALAAYLFFSPDDSADAPAVGGGQRVTLTLPRAQQVLEEAGMAAPDLSQYHYVRTDDLVGPKFENVVVGDPEELTEGGRTLSTRTVTADALFRNKGILITVPVSLPFVYDEENETWRQGELVPGEAVAQPMAAPNAATIVEDLDQVLTAYDPAVGTLFAGAAAKTSSRLTTEGGTITVTMEKDETVTEPNAEGQERQLLKHHNCTAEITVTWSEQQGWVPAVTKLNDEVSVQDLTPEQPGEGDGENGQGGDGGQGVDLSTVGQEGGLPSYGLKCSTGDLVELSGTVAGSPGALTFKPEGGLRLTLDGTERDVWSMGLTVSGDVDAASLVGRNVTVVGTISAQCLEADKVTIG